MVMQSMVMDVTRTIPDSDGGNTVWLFFLMSTKIVFSASCRLEQTKFTRNCRGSGPLQYLHTDADAAQHSAMH